ncbi:MAG TPA: TRAP transporter substrate-binding protein [Gammaproteobacteria bacterium]|jgi:tripartite ATP-independent transporter DctP family solute receptor|nr:TRAP transporter substrate-binding protein [Gammaproteobacteria bacterium]
MFKQVIAALIGIAIATCAQAAPRDVRIAYITSNLSPLYVDAKLFTEAINKKLPGQFKFTLYPNGQLGKEAAEIDNLELGSLEMGVVASGMTKAVRKLGIFDLPWLFSNIKEVRHALAGPLGKEIREQVKKDTGMIVIGIYENGFRDVINRERPINEPKDIAGLKIRVAGGKFRQDVFRRLGANPTPVDWTETFTALQTGVVDGAEAAIYGFYEAKLYEAAKYISLTHHVYSPSFLLVSNTFFKSLTPAQRKAFLDTGREIEDAVYKTTNANEQKYLKAMSSKVKINKVDIAAFRKLVHPVYDDYVKKEGGGWLKLIENARKPH